LDSPWRRPIEHAFVVLLFVTAVESPCSVLDGEYAAAAAGLFPSRWWIAVGVEVAVGVCIVGEAEDDQAVGAENDQLVELAEDDERRRDENAVGAGP
jgi:hypothetical protein